jgi:Cu-Zn family superoxide dismutase
MNFLPWAALLFLATAPVLVEAPLRAEAADNTMSRQTHLLDPKGNRVGEVKMQDTPHGVLLEVTISKLAPGEHAFHIHEVGKCEPDFKAAGGHFNPAGKEHGIENPKGLHAGDLANLHVPDSGRLVVELFARDVTLTPGRKNSLLDADGSAFVVHARADDYHSNPSGEAGDRIACGAITGQRADARR